VKKLLFILLCVPILAICRCDTNCIISEIKYSNAKYIGCINEYNQQHGTGDLFFNNGDSYTGCWLEGVKHGYGIYTFSEGDQYAGEYSDNMMHGIGTYLFPNGDKYVGEWKDNMKNGEGTFSYSDGSIWTGIWLDDEMLKGHFETENYYTKDDIIGEYDYSVINLQKIVNSSGDGCYNIALSFDTIHQEFLFDTGCSSMLINNKFLKKLEDNGLVVKKLISSSAIIASSEEVLMDQVIISNINVGDYTLNNLVVGVVKNGSLLCGMGLLKKFSNVEWNMNNETLKLYR
tara:strand:+ start:102 stop:965 length:864 start_codon:yes stop_codon:yes gene_type:complete